MKLTGDSVYGESSGEYSDGGGAGRTVVVGVKLDEQSKELLTWALVKVAQSGDRVIAVHVLNPHHTVSKSTLLSLVKTFDSVLAAYEGFCHLKQVDLKLKVCRGSSVQKVIVEEAKSYAAAKVVIGISRTRHTLWSTASVAKYCAKKLPKDCWVCAVDNGKVVFEREASNLTVKNSRDNDQHKNFVWLIHQSFSRSSKVQKADSVAVKSNHEYHEYKQRSGLISRRTTQMENGNIALVLPEDSFTQLKESSEDAGSVNSLVLAPIQTSEAISNESFIMNKDVTELKSEWPFLRQMILFNRQPEKFAARKSSEALTGLPSRLSSAAVYPDQKHSNFYQDEDFLSNMDAENTIVPIRSDAVSPPPSSLCCEKSVLKELEGLHEKYSPTCRLFSYEELLLATSNFMAENIVGRGGSSQVYRGCLPGGEKVAVKILKPSESVLKEFVSEIDILTSLHHKNIIALYGCCFEGNNLLLVYDFLSRGSLEQNLHGDKKDRVSFGWGERYKVALGAAEALDYLHSGSAQPVVHRDVKSSNILLSEDFEPQLSDFGLATWASTSTPHMTFTDVAGTFGYLAPEYFMCGKVNDKIDVYAYGVVILELLSGRRPINSEYPKGQESLVMWAKPILKDGKVSQLLDPSLDCDYDPDQMERMVLAATLCIKHTAQSRPQISHVLKLLQGDSELIEWAKQQTSELEEFDAMDGEVFPTNIQSHLNLALQGLDDDSLSGSSTDLSISVEDYVQGRWSRSSSFD